MLIHQERNDGGALFSPATAVAILAASAATLGWSYAAAVPGSLSGAAPNVVTAPGSTISLSGSRLVIEGGPAGNYISIGTINTPLQPLVRDTAGAVVGPGCRQWDGDLVECSESMINPTTQASVPTLVMG